MRSNRTCFLFVLGAALLGGAVLAVPEGSAGGQRSTSTLMEQGRQALLAGDFKAARDAYSDLLTVDSRNQLASEGATFAYAALGDYNRAKPQLEKAIELSSPPSRASAINGAAIYLHAKKPLRSIKLLVDYLRSISNVDEVALNALAITLNQTDDPSRRSRLYTDAMKFYALQNTKLEKLHPGMKRWGTNWVSADDADKDSTAWNAALGTMNQLQRELDTLNSHLATIQRNQRDPVFIQQQQLQNMRRGRKDIDPNDELDPSRLKTDIANKQAEFDKAAASAQRPAIPESIALVNVVAEPPLLLPMRPVQVADSQPTTGSTATTSPTTTATTQPAVATTSPATTAPALTHHVTTYAAAFPVGTNLLVSSAEAVADASDIKVQGSDGTAYAATVVRSDASVGLVLLRVPTGKFVSLSLADHFGGGSVSCVSFPSVDLFQPTAASINGSAPPPGKPWSVRLFETPRLGGGPLVEAGKVVGVELGSRDSDISAIPAVTLEDLRKFLGTDFAPPTTTSDPVAATVQVAGTRDK